VDAMHHNVSVFKDIKVFIAIERRDLKIIPA